MVRRVVAGDSNLKVKPGIFSTGWNVAASRLAKIFLRAYEKPGQKRGRNENARVKSDSIRAVRWGAAITQARSKDDEET